MAFRPITVHEVTDGIAGHPNQSILNRKTRSSNSERDLIQLCAPLLETSANGVLNIVHFAAREYLIREHSGPFIDVAQAHFSIVYSSIINLTTSLDLLPGYNVNFSELNLEAKVVQGNYGFHAYGHEFWAEQLVAYLTAIADSNNETRTLMRILEAFSRVYKHRMNSLISIPSKLSPEASAGLSKLQHLPALFNLALHWLLFKLQVQNTGPDINILDSQQQWLLQTDGSHLTHIKLRLQEITERFSSMSPSQLPSPIDPHDNLAFFDRCKLLCRYVNCYHCCGFVRERAEHEASHLPSFPCLQCDFSERGFTLRKDLERPKFDVLPIE